MSRRAGWLAGGIVLIVAVVAMPHLLDTYYLSLLAESLLYGIVALSLDLVWGYTGIPAISDTRSGSAPAPWRSG